MPQSFDPELETLLASAAAFGRVSQDVWCPTPEDAFGFVVDAIRSCILPRDLTVVADGAPRLRLVASGGHLLRILRSPTAATDPGADTLFDRPLSQADLDGVARLLQALSPGDEALSIETAKASVTPDAMSPGLSGPAILAQLSLLPFDAAVPDPLDYFMAAAEEVIFAVLRPGADADLRDAVQDIPQRMIDLAYSLLAAPDGPSALLNRDQLLCLHPEQAGPFGLALALTGDGPLAMIVDAGALPDLAGLWAGMSHGVVPCDP